MNHYPRYSFDPVNLKVKQVELFFCSCIFDYIHNFSFESFCSLLFSKYLGSNRQWYSSESYIFFCCLDNIHESAKKLFGTTKVMFIDLLFITEKTVILTANFALSNQTIFRCEIFAEFGSFESAKSSNFD